jgi:ribosome-binding factor A
MSTRTLRVNELVQRELNDILHTRWQAEAVTVTVTEVRVSPDLRDGRVFVSIVGSEEIATEKLRWLRDRAPEIRAEVSRRITLKYLPKFEYVLDHSAARSARLGAVLGDLEKMESPQDPPQE